MAPPPPLEANAASLPDTITQPLAVVSEPLPWRHTFISLKVRNFRIFAIGHFVAVIALWMQRIAQDWLVLQLSGSVTAVGITVALQFLPSLFLGPWAGMMADRFAKRKILMLCQSVAAVLAAVLAVLALSQRIEVWHVYVDRAGSGPGHRAGPARPAGVRQRARGPRLPAKCHQRELHDLPARRPDRSCARRAAADRRGRRLGLRRQCRGVLFHCGDAAAACARTSCMSAPRPQAQGHAAGRAGLCAQQAHHLLALADGRVHRGVRDEPAGAAGRVRGPCVRRRRRRLRAAEHAGGPRGAGRGDHLRPAARAPAALSGAGRRNVRPHAVPVLPRAVDGVVRRGHGAGRILVPDVPDGVQPAGPDQLQHGDPRPGHEPVHHGADRRAGHRWTDDRLAGRALGSAHRPPGVRRGAGARSGDGRRRACPPGPADAQGGPEGPAPAAADRPEPRLSAPIKGQPLRGSTQRLSSFVAETRGRRASP